VLGDDAGLAFAGWPAVGAEAHFANVHASVTGRRLEKPAGQGRLSAASHKTSNQAFVQIASGL
jgi:hypothetical protein